MADPFRSRRLLLLAACAASACGLLASSASADDTLKIKKFWSGTFSINYTESQYSGGGEHFEAAATIEATWDRATVITAMPGESPYAWQLFGPVQGSYSSSSSCSRAGTVGGEFELPPPEFDSYSFDQALSITGPRRPAAGGEYILGMWFVHVYGTEDCGDGPQPWEDHIGIPSSTLPEDPGADVLLRLPTSGPGGPSRTDGGGYRWTGTKTYSGTETDPDDGVAFGTVSATYAYDLTFKDDSDSTCTLQAKNPQKLKSAFVVTVRGGASGCAAKLKTAKLKVGNKVYTFIKKKPAKDVGAGEKWAVRVPISGQAKKIVKKALDQNKPVKAKAEFSLDDRSQSATAMIK